MVRAGCRMRCAGQPSARIISNVNCPVKVKNIDYAWLSREIKVWGDELGFQQVGITDTDLSEAERRLHEWLAQGWQGEMRYMAAHGAKRSRPEKLVPGTIRIISVRMNYFPRTDNPYLRLNQQNIGYIARYALGRDYHKLMRTRLRNLATKITANVGHYGYRIFVDSAPVLEKPLAAKAGLGWIGKHTNLVSRKAGNWFFLGELYTDLPLEIDQPATDHCGSCHACIDCCPTNAIVAPYRLDARRCISYLTIEHKGSIPLELRPLIGNRIYGCDDCLLACPWNRFAQPGEERDFFPRNGLDAPSLIRLFNWREDQFLQRLEGSPIRRIGYERWLRNIAVALGNSTGTDQVMQALIYRREYPSALVREHVEWALDRHGGSY